jgi:ferredoxin-NADP reductase
VDLRPERTVPRFKPGQFLHLALDEYDPSGFWPESRVFSIASSPAQRERLCISYSVRGRFTARMERELAEGRRVWVKLPYGEFVIDGTHDAVLFAGGTGITAFTAFLDGLTPAFGRMVYLAYGARSRALLIYRGMVQQRAQEVAQLHAAYFVERDAGANEVCGCTSVAALWPQIQAPLAALYYISGPPAMLKTIAQDLRERGVPPEAIRADAWE